MKNKKSSFNKEYYQALGLTEKEFEFYLVLVRLGKTTVQKAAFEMGVFRSSAYLLADSLAKKGLISQEFKKRGRYLIPEPPKVLTRLAEKKKKRLEKIQGEIEKKIPQLLEDYEKSLKDPVIKVYEGIEGLKAIHDDIIATGKTLYCYPRLDVAMKVLPKDFQLDFIKKRVEKGIKAKGLFPKSPEAKEIINESNKRHEKKSLREGRIIEEPFSEGITAEKMFYGDKVVYMTYEKKITGVLIEHEEIAALERRHFNLLWQKSLPHQY